MRKTPFLEDLLLCVGQLAFFPLSYFTLLPEIRLDLLGLGQSMMIEVVLWLLLIASSYCMIAFRLSASAGPLSRYAFIAVLLLFVITIPITLGFAAMSVVGFAVGGFDYLYYFWKPVLFFGFLWFWFTVDV